MEQQDKECHNRQKLRREERISPQKHQRERGPVDAEISDSQPPKPRIRATRFVFLRYSRPKTGPHLYSGQEGWRQVKAKVQLRRTAKVGR